jgi:integrase
MPRTIGRLTALKIQKAKQPGMHCDGGGLYLRVTADRTKNWVFRFMLNGRPRWMGMGPLHTIGLADARARASDCRRQRYDGIDPIDARRAQRQQARLDAAKTITFRECAEKYITAHKPGWRNEKHAAQWEATLATYAEPVIGKLSVQAIDTTLVLKVIEPLWARKPETAGRLRGRIESILNWAKVRGYRAGENPARWRGHLDKLLPARAKVRKVKHHAALPYPQIGAFMVELRARDGVAARALEFAIMTATRTGEVIGATWSEIDTGARLWVIPADRMKGGREHRVPLSAAALVVLDRMREIREGDHIFPSVGRRRPLSNMALLETLRRMGRGDLTTHGFRSTFRDWAAERTSFPNEVIEMALAHAISDAVEAAYRRGDLFDKRRRLMDAWSEFLAKAPIEQGKVVSLRSG